ncbi:conserved hypothetical protein [Roseibium sp. TrichSKD4]|nr:conserved hypothetical protein [Roseibium sp. TrichSKD4]
MPENACFGSTNRHIHTSKTQWVSILFNQLRGFSARTIDPPNLKSSPTAGQNKVSRNQARARSRTTNSPP